MARQTRIVVPGLPHHVVQRGNRRMDVFFNDEDRQVYLRWLRQASLRNGVEVWAYCLMRNHVHVVAVPEREVSLARCFRDLHGGYARRINERQHWKGHLWQDRFSSSVMDERYLLAAVRYIERNPVRVGIVHVPWEYRWSSAAFHVGVVERDPVVRGDDILRGLIGNWREYLAREDEAAEETIRRDTAVNRPLGNEGFLRNLAQRFHCRFNRLARGRPRKL